MMLMDTAKLRPGSGVVARSISDPIPLGLPATASSKSGDRRSRVWQEHMTKTYTPKSPAHPRGADVVLEHWAGRRRPASSPDLD
jgi:hypothetical protein